MSASASTGGAVVVRHQPAHGWEQRLLQTLVNVGRENGTIVLALTKSVSVMVNYYYGTDIVVSVMST